MKLILASYGLELLLLVVGTIFLWTGVKLKVKLVKHLLFNTSAILIALLFYEFIMTLNSKPQSEISYSAPYYIHNQELGYGVADSSFSVKATKRWEATSQEIYNATYTFVNGRRVTPNSDSLSNQYGLFLGGSFMFGEGVNDEETLPYLYNERAPEKINIRNYGFHGYGTHQVYHIVKNQIIRDSSLLNAENVRVFYWFFNEHIARTNGYSPWDQDGPSYAIKNDKLEFIGSFKLRKKNRSLIKRGLHFLWKNSAIFKWHLKTWWTTGEKEINLFLNLVEATNKLLKKQGYEFTVLILNSSKQDKLFGEYQQGGLIRKTKQYFDTHGISFLDMREITRPKADDTQPLFIPGDGHPTGEFNRRLASYLWDKSNAQLRDKTTTEQRRK